MSIIQKLEPQVVNKIAAGEVVQRPASVVKELLDNAIDAGADQIELEINQAGKSLIQVTDNGCGMSVEDLPLCFERHATSKISSEIDLQRLRTMGFRGEAMASIAAISQIRVQTRRVEDEHGWRHEIRGGDGQSPEPDAVESGTQVRVQHLFYNVPARRQFLKSDATEFRHILRVFQQHALAHTDIAFRFVADSDTVYDLPIQSLHDRISDLFGPSYKPNLISVEESTSYVSVRGVLADPAFGKKSRGEQFLFVNGRPFQDRLLTYQILKEYEYWKKPDEYPFYALFLELDPEKVDINVHPSKMEVKFEDDRSVYRLVTTVVKKAINSYRHVPDYDYQPVDGDSGTQPMSAPPSFHFGSQDIQQQDRQQLFQSSNWSQQKTYIPKDAAERLYGPDQHEMPQEESTQQQTHTIILPEKERNGINSLERTPDSLDGRTLWQLHQRYIVTQTASGLSLIDQHAAHKRILFEQALQNLDAALPGTQQLLFAQTVHFSKSDFMLLEEVQPLLKRIGFSIDLLSGYSCIISGVPADVEMGDEKTVIEGILADYHQLGSMKEMAPEHRMALALAEQTAIKAGKKLSQMEMEHLIDRLFACQSPYIDPKGRPTIQVISMEEIQKRFKGLPLR